MQVFVSSTCYDLIDLRAELEVFLREAGVTPILSDSMTSDFQVQPNGNSIETCLANVRQCDEFLIVLSQRYGPSLKSAGFDDVSATHLEYREAVKAKKPIRMFVRNRLEADYAIWKKNNQDPEVKLSWCKDRQLFELLEEHRALTASKDQSNWFWVFQDSTQLKQRITTELQGTFAAASAKRLFLLGRVPYIEITATIKMTDPQQIHFDITFKNLSAVPAVSPVLELTGHQPTSIATLTPGAIIAVRKFWARGTQTVKLDGQLDFSILEGHKFCLEATLTLTYDIRMAQEGQRYTLGVDVKGRRYLGSSPGFDVKFS